MTKVSKYFWIFERKVFPNRYQGVPCKSPENFFFIQKIFWEKKVFCLFCEICCCQVKTGSCFFFLLVETKKKILLPSKKRSCQASLRIFSETAKSFRELLRKKLAQPDSSFFFFLLLLSQYRQHLKKRVQISVLSRKTSNCVRAQKSIRRHWTLWGQHILNSKSFFVKLPQERSYYKTSGKSKWK